MSDPLPRACTACGETFPHDEEHFRRAKDGTWEGRCRPCMRVHRAERSRRKNQRQMKAVESRAVGTFLGAAALGGENIPHSSELLENLMRYFGGSSGFSALLVKHFFDCPPGGAHRTKMIEAVVRLVTKNTEMGGAKKPMSQWSDEELEQELDARFRRVAMNMAGRLPHGTPETPADFAAAFGAVIGILPAAAASGTPGGVGEPPDRSVEAVPADAPAGSVSPGHGE